MKAKNVIFVALAVIAMTIDFGVDGFPKPKPNSQCGGCGHARYEYSPKCRQQCPVAKEYRPVCGSDGRVYRNMEMLECASSCEESSRGVTFVAHGSCHSNCQQCSQGC